VTDTQGFHSFSPDVGDDTRKSFLRGGEKKNLQMRKKRLQDHPSEIGGGEGGTQD